MGYRYKGSPVIITSGDDVEPEWNFRNYIPSTYPGCRAPHVFLADGKTSILDLYGIDYTLVDFTLSGATSKVFSIVAHRISVPLKHVHLPHESHIRKVWERDIVLVRPDGHVAWRSRKGIKEQSHVSEAQAQDILAVATGKAAIPRPRG